MHIALWVLQMFLAFHTAMGALWKFTNPAEQSMPSLQAIPHSLWLTMSGVELLLALALVIPFFKSSLSFLAPLAAVVIAAEMFLFCGVHLASGDPSYGPIIYWLVVAAVCAFIAYGRWTRKV